MYKVIIVDDELRGRELIRALLTSHNDFEVIAECSSVKEAKNVMLQEKPDLLFLDIQMPEYDGFDLAYQLEHLGIEVPIVFVTAYQEYMLKAFKVQPLGYLLKPVNPQDFSEVLFRFKKQYKSTLQTQCADYILLTTVQGIQQVCVNDICYITIAKKIVEVYLVKGKSIKSSITLSKLGQSLPADTFFRISKSAIVNLNSIDVITTTRELTLKTHTVKLKIGKEYFIRLKRKLTII